MATVLPVFDVPDWLALPGPGSIFVLAVILLGLLMVYRSDHIRDGKLPPGPWGLPVLGCLPFMSKDAPYQTLTRWAKKYGPIYNVRLGLVRVVVLSDPRLIRQAFGKDVFTGKPPLPVTYGILKGYGVFAAEGKLWKEQRRFLMDSLRTLGANRRSQDRDTLDQKIGTEVDECLKAFADHDGQPFNCELIFSFTIGNIIFQILFGRRYPLGDEEFTSVLRDIALGFKMVGVVGAINFIPFLRFVPFFRRAFDLLLSMQKDHQIFLRSQIAQTRETRKETEAPRNLVDLFLRQMEEEKDLDESTFSERQLVQMVGDLLAAGMETSAQTLQWLMLYVSLRPEIQARIHEELDRVIGADRKPEMEDLARMPYLDAVILETQRFCSLVPLGAPHGTTQEAEIDGFVVPPNTMVVALLWFVSRDVTLWGPDADQFEPKRFLNEDGTRNTTPDAFLPFSAGRRMCPGDDLARRELFLFASAIFQRFTILPAEGAEEAFKMAPEMGFTLTPQPFKIRAVIRPK